MKRTNPDFLNGVPELVILELLTRRPMHGYDVVQAIVARSKSALTFGEGCVYPTLHRMEAEKLLSSTRELVSGRQRLVYQITPAGRKKLTAARHEWSRVVDAVRSILEGQDDGTGVLAT